MNFSFKVIKKDKITRARVGVVSTPNGKFKTPTFSPVATKASVKTLDSEDLKKVKAQVILGNTYHLYLQPGVEVIKKFGGFAPFMKWSGPTITDSGGYQISFLWQGSKDRKIAESGRIIRISDKGATFSSHIDGSIHLLTPEKSMQIQHFLGADIIMAFDQPLSYNRSRESNKAAFKRTLAWEEKSFAAWQKLEAKRKHGTPQTLFGIIQGETDAKLRKESLKFILGTGFPGIAIGGESIGSDPKITAAALDTVANQLPDDKPLHALGLGGGPEGIFAAVEGGVDIFDNTSITRMARTGLLFIHPEDGGGCGNKFRLDISKKIYKDDKKPISKTCSCFSCSNYSKAYLHHLMAAKEILGLRLASIHNVYYINDLMEKIRKSLTGGDFISLKKYWLKKVDS